MAGNLLKIDVDASGVLQAFARLEPAMAKRIVEDASRTTALAIQREALARVRRGATGKTAAGIIVERATSGEGYVVISSRRPLRALPGWIEFGTEKWPKLEFLFPAARLEEGPHLQRVAQAINDAIGEANR